MPITPDDPDAPGTSLLFTAGEISEALGRTVPEPRAIAAERMVWGWLQPILSPDIEVRPDPVPAKVFSWAVELGAIYHENPTGLASEQLGPAQRAFSSERRAEILQLAADGGSTAGALTPQGSFPPAQRYPDPACGW